MKRRQRSGHVLVIAIVFLAAACTGSEDGQEPSGAENKGELVISNFGPFTGPNAPFGPEMIAGCEPAAKTINENGGVLGYTITCESLDSHGDPADAVPAVTQMIATTPNLFGVIGPTSNEVDATAPLLNDAQIPMFSPNGLDSFTKTDLAYFYRLVPSDNVKGYVLALWADMQGYTRGAAVFGNDAGSQSNVPTLLQGYKELGHTMVINLKIAQDQTSYRTEVAQLVQANPDVIFTESSPQTASTFLAELQQQADLIPVIGTDVTLQPPWLKAVTAAIGQSDMNKFYVGEQPYAPPEGAAWQTFNEALLASSDQVPDPSQWSSDPYSMTYYDSAVLMALAATAANSVDPSKYNEFILAVTDPSPDATVVNSYAEGVKALAAGDTIRYEGASGTINFNQYHNNVGVAFEFVKAQPDGSIKIIGKITGDQVAPLIS
jgi:ABC-type branched-subunit amino acid transport system substrate-binding protein